MTSIITVKAYIQDNFGSMFISFVGFFFASCLSMMVYYQQQTSDTLKEILVANARKDMKDVEQDNRINELEEYKSSHTKEYISFFKDYEIKKKQ